MAIGAHGQLIMTLSKPHDCEDVGPLQLTWHISLQCHVTQFIKVWELISSLALPTLDSPLTCL